MATVANKRILVVAVLALALVTLATLAGALTKGFEWDANTEPDLAGYKLYCGTTAGGPYSFVKDIADPTAIGTPADFPDGEYDEYCALTAYDTSGNESGYSNEVTFRVDTVSPAAPRSLRFTP